MSLTLSDALSHYRSISDTTHRFWGYFQAVAAGTAAFAWSREAPAGPQLIVLSFAFTVFAVFNWRLVVRSQAESVVAAKCVKAYALSANSNVPSELLPVIQDLEPGSAAHIGILHAGVTIATLGAVLSRLLTC